jgi:hypothetical protein
MAMDGLPVERLRVYLRQLPQGARALLIAELERAVMRGEEIPGGQALLDELRIVARDSHPSPPRSGDPSRLFFRALEPFLIDDDPAHKQLGRIARKALDPIWAWICRDLAPREANIYSDEAGRALLAGDDAACARLAADLQDCVVIKIQAALTSAKADDRMRRRMIGQIGTPKAIEDVRDLLIILSSRDVIATIESRLPEHVRNLADAQLDTVKAVLDLAIVSRHELLPYALVLTMAHLAAPWQVVRLAVKSAESDDATRISASPYAIAVTMVLADIERMVLALKNNLKRGATVEAAALIKSVHDAARGLRTELDLSGDSPWARQLVAIRSDVADVLKGEVESVSGRVRRLLRPRPAGEIARNSALDPGDVTETEALIELLGTCRHYASELAVSEVTLRTFSELQQYLDTGTRTLIDGLRQAGDSDALFRQSQVDAAVRFCAKVFGEEYAALLAKAAEVAANAAIERKTAAKAG